MVKSEPVTPLDRPKAIESLGGLVEPEPLPRLLIGIMPLFHLGNWLTWTIATPIRGLGVSDHGNAIWSAQISLFLQTILSLPLLHIFLWKIFLSFYCVFWTDKVLSRFKLSIDGTWSILIRRLFARFDFLLTSYYGVTRCFITRHGLHGKPALYIYRSWYLLQQCGFMKPPLQDWLSQLHAQRWQVLCISKIWSYA